MIAHLWCTALAAAATQKLPNIAKTFSLAKVLLEHFLMSRKENITERLNSVYGVHRLIYLSRAKDNKHSQRWLAYL